MRRMDVPEIIRAMLRLDGMNQGKLADRLGVSQPTVSRWQSGAHLPDFQQAQRLQQAAIEMGLLSKAKHELSSTVTVEIRGLVGLGEGIEWLSDDHDHAFELVELPFPVPEGCVALEARGDSMSPRVKSGEVVVVRFNSLNPREMIGQEVVVKVKDGPWMLKTLRRGYEPDRFNLESFNAPLRENVELETVGELWAIVPAKRWIRHR